MKAFLTHHASTYDNFEVRYIGGADPELVFVKHDNSIGERIMVDEMETKEICDLLEARGIPKKSTTPVEEEDEEDDFPGMERGFEGHAGAPSDEL